MSILLNDFSLNWELDSCVTKTQKKKENPTAWPDPASVSFSSLVFLFLSPSATTILTSNLMDKFCLFLCFM